MKNVLLISSYPYTHTSRGMDLLTEAFENLSDWQVTHLTFPLVSYTVKKKPFPTSVREITGKKVLLPYVDRFMHGIPRSLFQFLVRHNARSLPEGFSWSDYDLVVLESGKPLFLLDQIPPDLPIIYRQSDSVRYILGKNPDYHALEDAAIERARAVLVTKQRWFDTIPAAHQDKTRIILNGFSPPSDAETLNPYPSGTKNAVYVGLPLLDVKTLLLTAQQNPQIHLHLFGPCLTPWDQRRVRSHERIHYYGFRSRQEFIPYIQHGDAAVFPFKQNTGGMNAVGFSSKFFRFMYYRLPILSFLPGGENEFKDWPIHFVKTPREFALAMAEILKNPGPVEYPVDWEFFSNQGRRREYTEFIQEQFPREEETP